MLRLSDDERAAFGGTSRLELTRLRYLERATDMWFWDDDEVTALGRKLGLADANASNPDACMRELSRRCHREKRVHRYRVLPNGRVELLPLAQRVRYSSGNNSGNSNNNNNNNNNNNKRGKRR